MARFSNLVDAEARSYGLTEWNGKLGGEDVSLFATPLTAGDFEHAARRTKNPNFTQSPTIEGMVEILIRKCRDEHGEAAFNLVDKSGMMKWKTDLIAEIFGALFGDLVVDDEAVEDHVKN